MPYPSSPVLRRCGLALALSAALTGAAGAAEGGKADKPGGPGYVDLSPVAVPVISHGRLVNYVFLTLRLNLRPGGDASKLRQEEPFFRDALVRLSHRTPLNPPNDFTRLNDPVIKAAMTTEVAHIAGPKAVASIQVVSETPQRRTGLPTP